MPFSYATTVSSGSTALVSVPFSFLDRAHVHVLLNGTLVDDGTLTWISNGQIQLASTPSSGTTIKVYRRTPLTTLQVEFGLGDLDPNDLNANSTQALYATQEAEDDAADATAAAAAVGTQLDTANANSAAAVETANEAKSIAEAAAGIGDLSTDSVSNASTVSGANTSDALETLATALAGKVDVGGLTKSDVGLGSVDNTADASKPVSTPQQLALNAKAPINSAVLTGTPTAPTPANGDTTTKIATMAAVSRNHTLSRQTVTTSGAFTWTKPTGLRDDAIVYVQLWGAGAGGAVAANGNAGGGGGGYNEWRYFAGDLPSSVTGSVGAGGAISTDGGDTTFGTLTAPGGEHGVTTTPGLGGDGSDLQDPWVGGKGGVSTTPAFNSGWGGGGGGGQSVTAGSYEGDSVNGGQGGQGGPAANCTNGTAPGGGGACGKAGANGKAVITIAGAP